jgi:light-regulated signal transduction histidine kinase (bacteriophytochrome)
MDPEQRTHNPLVLSSNPSGPTNQPIDDAVVQQIGLSDCHSSTGQLKLFSKLIETDYSGGESDTGHGMPVDNLHEVFDPFFTTKPNGIEMGLPISRTIIEPHGGRLWVENKNDGGAVFRFTLPIAEEVSSK